MKTKIIAASLAASLMTAAVAVAQPAWGPRGGPGGGPAGRGAPMSAEDRAAFTDARIAALKAVLRLTPEQERHWPAFETALREAAAQRAERLRRWREMRANPPAERPDPVQRLRAAADRMAERAAAVGKLADAAQPLYASLDEAQKRRVERLMRRGQGMMGRGMMGRDMMGPGMMRRGMDHGGGSGRL